MKKILATLFIMLSVAVIAQTEYFVFNITLTAPHGTEVKDEKGSPIVYVDLRPIHYTRIIRAERQLNKRTNFQICVVNVNAKTGKKSINYTGISQYGLFALNPSENDINGLVAFDLSFGCGGVGLPSIQCHLGGETVVKYDEAEKRYITISASGGVAGCSYPTNCKAYENTAIASYAGSCKIFPAWGYFTMTRRDNLTTDEICKLLGK